MIGASNEWGFPAAMSDEAARLCAERPDDPLALELIAREKSGLELCDALDHLVFWEKLGLETRPPNSVEKAKIAMQHWLRGNP